MVKNSVIIPTYGNPVFLEKSINSVLNQSMNDLELIIVDDNNPNTEARSNTEYLVNKYLKNDNRVIYLKHDYNMNGAVARNTGFSVAKGKYISLLDSDDEYMPGRLQKFYDVMEHSDSKIAGVYSGCEFRRKGRKYHVEDSVPSGNFLAETLACTFMFCTGSNIFVRKSVVDELEGFDGSFLRHQDYEFLVRLFLKYDLIGLPEVLVIKNNEYFNRPNAENAIAIKRQYLDKFKTIIDNLSDKDRCFIYNRQAVSIAESAMAENKIRLANHYYKIASRYGSLNKRDWIRRISYPIYNLFN